MKKISSKSYVRLEKLAGMDKQAEIGDNLMTLAGIPVDMAAASGKALLAAGIAAPVLAGASLGRVHSLADEPTDAGIEGIQQGTLNSELDRQNARLDRLMEIDKKRREAEARKKKSRGLRLA